MFLGDNTYFQKGRQTWLQKAPIFDAYLRTAVVTG